MIVRAIKYPISYAYKHIFLPKILSRRYSVILKDNKSLEGKFQGQQCFVIGGGPSLKDINLKLLEGEQTFVVNEFDKHPDYRLLMPSNHAIMDPDYFTLAEDHHLTQQFIKKSETIRPETTVFMNILAKPFIEKRGLFKKHKIHYIAMQGIYSDKFNFNIKIEKVVPWPKNSILMCLLLATYMGFEKIYIIGCEHNFLATNIGIGKALTFDHAYSDGRELIDTTNPEEAKKYTVEKDLYLPYERQIAHIKQLFTNYRLLNGKIAKLYPQTQIFNATPDSFLDVFPSIDFKDIKLTSK